MKKKEDEKIEQSKTEQSKTEQSKPTPKAARNLITSKQYKYQTGTKYRVINKGGTLVRTKPKKLGNRQKRKLGLLPKREEQK